MRQHDSAGIITPPAIRADNRVTEPVVSLLAMTAGAGKTIGFFGYPDGMGGMSASIRRHFVVTVHLGHLGRVWHDEHEEPSWDTMDDEQVIGWMTDWWTAIGHLNPRYACGQVERGEDGTLHVQAYVEFRDGIRARTCGLRYGGHWEPRRGTRTQARSYCTKDDTRVQTLAEHGQWREEATRKADARSMAALVMAGWSPRSIALSYPTEYMAHARGVINLWEAIHREMWIPQEDIGDAMDIAEEEE